MFFLFCSGVRKPISSSESKEDSDSDTPSLNKPIPLFASSGSDEWQESENHDPDDSSSLDESELHSKSASKKKKKMFTKRIQKERSKFFMILSVGYINTLHADKKFNFFLRVPIYLYVCRPCQP